MVRRQLYEGTTSWGRPGEWEVTARATGNHEERRLVFRFAGISAYAEVGLEPTLPGGNRIVSLYAHRHEPTRRDKGRQNAFL